VFDPKIHVDIYLHSKYIRYLVNTFYCYLSNDFFFVAKYFSFALHSMLIVNPNFGSIYILKFTLYLEEGNYFEVVKTKKVICQNHHFHNLHYHVSQCVLL
jgi:hypothetical protein